MWLWSVPCFLFFFFNDTATTEIYTLSLHDALPISLVEDHGLGAFGRAGHEHRRLSLAEGHGEGRADLLGLLLILGILRDRKSTRLNSSHQIISYAVFCLKKKKDDEGRGDAAYRWYV